MLVRIAESLYWTGRYIKRAMYLAKFVRVQYFSTLDASMALNIEFTLRSILNMSGVTQDAEKALNEQDVLVKVGFDVDNPSSILSTIVAARENTRALRHVLSSEVWESTNVMYHFAKNYSVDYYKQRGLYEFTTKVEENVKIIRSNIHSTMLRTDEYYFLMLGSWLEETIQILRILRSKMYDMEVLSQGGENIPLMQYQWTITLKSLESFDMHNKFYHHMTSTQSVVEFLISNPKFPRSLYYNISHLIRDLKKISVQPRGFHAFIFDLEKMQSDVKFFTYTNNDDLHDFLEELMKRVSSIHDVCARLYFNKE
jgi:uncharacterized alpha-E superfamily protein